MRRNTHVLVTQYNILQGICKVFDHAIFCNNIVIRQIRQISLKNRRMLLLLDV